MDPIAHTLFGATMAEAGLKQKTALATATLVIGANIPDLDALAMFVSNDFGLYFRRGLTHGIVALLAWPFLLAGAMSGIDRLLQKRKTARRGPPLNRSWLLGCAFLGVWSHPLLDWLNTYGVRLLMPFNDTWFYGDTLFIIDPWLWLLTGAAVVLARSESWKGISAWIVLGTALTALVTTADIVPSAAKIFWGAGIALIVIVRWSGRYRQTTQPVAAILLGTAILYAAIMFTGARMTVSHARAHLASDGVETIQIMANPLPARILLRGGVASSETHYYRFVVNWTVPESFELIGEPIAIQSPDPIVEAALRSPDIRGLMNWIRFPHYEVSRLDEGWRVIIRDLRYVDPERESLTTTGIGMAVVDLDEKLRVIGLKEDS
jgi:inner membrane protein